MGNFEVSISSFQFSLPGFRENSYLVLQTSAQSSEVKWARINRFECKRIIDSQYYVDPKMFKRGYV